MKYFPIDRNTTYAELYAIFGNDIESILALNGLSSKPRIGQEFFNKCDNLLKGPEFDMSTEWNSVSIALNNLSGSDDVYEKAATMDTNHWKIMLAISTFYGYLRIPDSIDLPLTDGIIGSNTPVSARIVAQVNESLSSVSHEIPQELFNTVVSTITPGVYGEYDQSLRDPNNPIAWFPVPWGSIMLYSELFDDFVYIPVYPQELSDGVKANFTTMPDLLYQYEPWQIYTGSGPRENTYTFDFHRDMWGGDHRQGGANNMIRFCQANCYPKYNGSAVDYSLVILYIAGMPLIRGVLTQVETKWDGPIGQDGFYLHCVMTLHIIEVSSEPLNIEVMRNKPLIG